MPDRELPPLAGEEHVCEACGIRYADLTVAEALDTVAGLPERYAAAVAAVPASERSVRPEPAVWSVAEYVCHVRDVFVSFTIRLYRVRTEDRPALEPMYNDLRAARFGYRERPLPPVLDELAAAVAGFAEEARRVRTDGWERTGSRRPGEERTARWLVRQALHEGVHHLADVSAVAARVTHATHMNENRHPDPA